MKQWLDNVLTHGWAYGSQGNVLTDKVVSLAVSLGTPARHYQNKNRIGGTVDDILLPFKFTINYCHADYHTPFTFHTIDSHATYDVAYTLITQSTADYIPLNSPQQGNHNHK